eukprot:COSAG03_NODE_2134_length_3090_cov_20.282180_6_plen_166_part_01
MSRPPTFRPKNNFGAKPTCLHRSKALDVSFPTMQTRRLSPGNFLREQLAQSVGNPNTVVQLAAAAESLLPAGRPRHREFPTRVNSDNYEKWAVYSPRGPAGLRPSSFSEKVLGRGSFCPSHFHSQLFCDLTGVLTVVCRILSVAEFSTSLVLVVVVLLVVRKYAAG